jgi:hypothetical protein
VTLYLSSPQHPAFSPSSVNPILSFLTPLLQLSVTTVVPQSVSL